MEQNRNLTGAASLHATESRLESTPPSTDHLVPALADRSLPVRIVKREPARNWLIRVVIALAVLAGGAGASYYGWQRLHPQLPAGIAFGNGRLEADEIDIDTKYAGRIAEILADEGDMVKAGQVVARMDTRDLEASLKKSQAQVRAGAAAPSTKQMPM